MREWITFAIAEARGRARREGHVRGLTMRLRSVPSGEGGKRLELRFAEGGRRAYLEFARVDEELPFARIPSEGIQLFIDSFLIATEPADSRGELVRRLQRRGRRKAVEMYRRDPELFWNTRRYLHGPRDIELGDAWQSLSSSEVDEWLVVLERVAAAAASWLVEIPTRRTSSAWPSHEAAIGNPVAALAIEAAKRERSGRRHRRR